MEPLRIAVIGTGHLGNHHTRLLSGMPGVSLVGIHDPDSVRMMSIATKYGVRPFDDPDELLDLSDAVIVASPTSTHRAVVESALQAGCHVMVEKPIAESSSEGEGMVEAADRAGKTLMVGHVEHFNPAFEAAFPFIESPRFIESHRLTIYRGRGADVSVVHDLLIHDLELLLAILGEEIIEMQVSGGVILTDSPDIANVRLRFEGGCVANLTASRISLTDMRKMRVFQEGAYIGIDFGGDVEIAVIEGAGPEPPEDVDRIDIPGGERIIRWRVPVTESNALMSELVHFVRCVRTGETPRVSGRRGLKALQLADRIIENLR